MRGNLIDIPSSSLVVIDLVQASNLRLKRTYLTCVDVLPCPDCVNRAIVWRFCGKTSQSAQANWAQDDFRKSILNCIIWTAHVDVPKDGAPSKTPTLDELLANQDKKVPASLNRERLQKQIDAMNHPIAATQLQQ